MGILKKISKVLSTIVFWLLIVIIIFLIGYIVLINIYKKEDKLGEIPINFYTILTTSMEPNIKAGDIVITYKDKNNLYKVGNVITFVSESNSSKGITITHRIVNVNKDNNIYYYYTKGDNNNTADFSPVSQNSVIGKVVVKIPKAGFVQQFLVSKFGWLVAIVLPCLGIIIYDVLKIFKKIIRKQQEKKLITKNVTLDSKEDLKSALEDKYLSSKLQAKINNVYETNGIEIPKEEVEILNVEPEEEEKEEINDDTEIL